MASLESQTTPTIQDVPGRALTVLAAALPDSLKIQHMAHDDSWTESPRLWSAVIAAPPGTTKTPALNAMMAPLHKAEQKLAARHGRAMAGYRAEQKLHKADPLNHEEPVLPVESKLLTNETTIEGLADALKDNPRGMMVCADELTGLIGSFDAYRGNGAKKDRAAWLEAWNGGRRVIDRKVGGRTVVPNWGVSLVGGIQPEKLAGLVAGGLADDGLMQRMLLYAGRQLGKRLDRKPDAAAAALYEKLIERATELKSDLGLTVTLEPDAQPHRERVWALVDAFRVMPWAPAPLKEHLSKWPALFARLLLVLHAAEGLAAGDTVEPVVSEKTARRAADLMVGFFLPHALKAYREFFGGKASKALSDARWVAGFLLSKERGTVTRRDVKRAYRALAKDDKAAEQALRDLELAGWVQRDETAKSDSSGWRVNPKIYRAFADRAKSEAERRRQVREDIQNGAKIIKGEFRH